MTAAARPVRPSCSPRLSEPRGQHPLSRQGSALPRPTGGPLATCQCQCQCRASRPGEGRELAPGGAAGAAGVLSARGVALPLWRARAWLPGPGGLCGGRVEHAGKAREGVRPPGAALGGGGDAGEGAAAPTQREHSASGAMCSSPGGSTSQTWTGKRGWEPLPAAHCRLQAPGAVASAAQRCAKCGRPIPARPAQRQGVRASARQPKDRRVAGWILGQGTQPGRGLEPVGAMQEAAQW